MFGWTTTTFLLLIVSVFGSDFYDGLVNTRVQIATYLTSPVTKILVTTEVKNIGDTSVDTYFIAVPKSLSDNLSRLEATVVDSGTSLTITEETSVKFPKKFKSDTSPNDAIYYSVKLPKTLDAGSDDTIQLKLTIAYIHLLDPLPATIKKSSKQYVVYQGNRYFFTPYNTDKLGVKFTLASDKIKSYTKPANQKDKKITYGPYNDLSPFSYSSVRFHFQFHVPFLTMTLVNRDMEISHWGNVRIEESFELHHDGPSLKGAYEPGVMDRVFQSGDPSVVTSLKATLPKSAHGVYYVDRIGNVSTSHFRSGQKASYLELRPRYPLYGGWKTDFTIGYDVPSQDLISIDPKTREHTLNVSFGIPFKEPVTDLLITTIALPEGAFDVKIDCPYGIELEDSDNKKNLRRFTYLDTQLFGGGRPLIRFRKKNVVHLHNGNFQVKYKYDKNRIYYKPFLIVTGILMFLVTIMIWGRINPSLDDDEEQSMRKATLLEHAPGVNQNKKRSSNGNDRMSNDGDDILQNIDINVDADQLFSQLHEARTELRESKNNTLRNRVNKAYNKAKKFKGDKDELSRIILNLQQS